MINKEAARIERVKNILGKAETELNAVEILKSEGCEINVRAKLKGGVKQRFDLNKVWSWGEKDLHLTSFSMSSDEMLRLKFICDNEGCTYCEGV